jgi:hypothetical protein
MDGAKASSMTTKSLSRRVSGELPGPRARALLSRGRFDMQSGYRAVAMDDEQSFGVHLVDADDN